MRAGLIEEYSIGLSKPEMDELMTVFRTHVREFEASEVVENMLAGLEQIYRGGGQGLGIEWPVLDDEPDEPDGGAPVAG